MFFVVLLFKGSFAWAVSVYSPESGLMANVLVLTIAIFFYWSRSLGLVQGRISSLLVNLVFVVSTKMMFL